MAISTMPINDLRVKASCKKQTAKINVRIILILSIATTLETTPICKAL